MSNKEWQIPKPPGANDNNIIDPDNTIAEEQDIRYFVNKFIQINKALPDMNDLNTAFGKIDENSRKFKAYAYWVKNAYNNYVQGQPILDQGSLSWLEGWEYSEPKFSKTRFWINRAIKKGGEKINSAPRLPSKVEKYAKYAAVPGGLLFTFETANVLSKLFRWHIGGPLTAIIGGMATDYLQAGLNKRHPKNAIKVPNYGKLYDSITDREDKEWDMEYHPKVVYGQTNRELSKLMGKVISRDLSKPPPREEKPISNNMKGANIAPNHTVYMPSGGGGGNRLFFYNGRKYRRYHNKFGYNRTRRFRYRNRKIYKKYNKRYRRYRRHYI